MVSEMRLLHRDSPRITEIHRASSVQLCAFSVKKTVHGLRPTAHGLCGAKRNGFSLLRKDHIVDVYVVQCLASFESG